MGVLRLKDGARLDGLAPAGFRLIGVLDKIVRAQPFDLTITEGTGAHPPNDPHTKGQALDVRTHNLTDEQKRFVLQSVLLELAESPLDQPLPVSIGFATMQFYGQLEHPGQPNEHLHFQQRNGALFP